MGEKIVFELHVLVKLLINICIKGTEFINQN